MGTELLKMMTNIIKKIKLFIGENYYSLRKAEWDYVQSHLSLRRFAFTHCRVWYTKLRYFIVFHTFLHLSHPKTFHEKLFWLSVYYRHPLIMQCADKYQVREYVRSKIGDEILNTLYGVYDSADKIEFDRLPKSFVIKSNKGSGDNFFCTDKDAIDPDKTIRLLDSWKVHECGIDTAEYQYDKIPFKLCCEKYLTADDKEDMIEYQFFCFNGKPVSILVRNDLETSGEHPFAVSYSTDWKREYLRINEESYDVDIPKPNVLDKMIDYATRLSAPFPHVRVDFYLIGEDTLVFGELTFSSSGNLFANYKKSALEQWNTQLVLPKRYTSNDRY